jgi:MobA/MobL family
VTGLGAKTDIELKDADRAKKGLSAGRVEVTEIRERWAALVNEHLAERGHRARVDHRSLEAQGVDREPTVHKGHVVTAIERRGERAYVAERIG